MSRLSHPASRRRVRPVHHAMAAAALAALQSGAWAQHVEAGKLQTVQVTAERRAENIKDVPSSVSTLQGEMLDVHQHQRAGHPHAVRAACPA
jgi:outer membrane receptor protein involved in Fe transport